MILRLVHKDTIFYQQFKFINILLLGFGEVLRRFKGIKTDGTEYAEQLY